MQIQSLYLTFFLTISFHLNSQVSENKMDSLYHEIEFLIGDSWYFEEITNGFQVTFCKTCRDSYKRYLDTTNLFNRNLTRSDFFKPELIDSVSYYSTVSNTPISPNLTKEEKINHYSKIYRANNIMKFEIRFEEKWTQNKIETIQNKNNQLRDSILTKPLYKSNEGIFSDYRYWLPDRRWKERTIGLDFYFERLPYNSLILDRSIFIYHNKPFYFSRPMLVDKNDPEYFFKSENELENERQRVLKVIALALGIHDYKVVN